MTSEHARQFREDGFFVLRGIVPPGDLDMLRGECQRAIDARERVGSTSPSIRPGRSSARMARNRGAGRDSAGRRQAREL